MKYITSAHQMPSGTHFVILHFSSIYIPGDERSRNHPGHGYPESNQPIVNYIIFDTEDEWKNYITKHPECIPLIANRPTITRKTIIEFS